MADHYNKLTKAEKAYWDIYARLREITDWDGFSEGQRKIKMEARLWLTNQRKAIWRAAQPRHEGGDGKGWKTLNRAARYEQLRESNLNTARCRRLCMIPSNGNTPGEKAGIAERRMWWRVESVDKQTRQWRQSNADWCTNTRRSIYTLAHHGSGQRGTGGWDRSDRLLRYNNLCIATRTGDAYKIWTRDHNTTTGKEKPKPKPHRPHATGGKGRDACVANMRRYLGVSEHPPGSNRGSPQPDGWQRRVIGATGYAWCACFASCMAWDAGVKGAGSAAVYGCYSLARQGAGIYRGVTTDPSRVRRGDHAVIGSLTTHIETVVSDTNPMHCIGGNSGNSVRENYRSRGQIVCWLLVDYN